jgi:RNA 2',3'-cyclic 3'-phosphodiesterase
MQRLFTGIQVPSAVSQQLALLKGGVFAARWMDPANYHITLRFAGEVTDRVANELHMMLAHNARAPLTIELEKLDVFGGDRPRALIVRVTLTDALRDLQAEHERICRRIGLATETRKFTPHITLARLRDVSAHDTAEWLMQKGVFRRQSFTAQSIALFSSRSSTGGGPYVVEEHYPLSRIPALHL